MASLDKEFKFYQSNRENFLSKYEGKFIVIKGEEVIGVFEDRIEAVDATEKEHELGTFLVQHVTKESKIFFNSRVRIKKNAA